MNVPLIVAGALSLLAAGVHGIVGEMLVVRRLSPAELPRSTFGGGAMTKSMIRAAWHLTTAGFLTVAAALLLAGSVVEGEAARALGLVGASASTAFAVVVTAIGLRRWLAQRSIPRHPAIVVLPAIPILAWWGLA